MWAKFGKALVGVCLGLALAAGSLSAGAASAVAGTPAKLAKAGSVKLEYKGFKKVAASTWDDFSQASQLAKEKLADGTWYGSGSYVFGVTFGTAKVRMAATGDWSAQYLFEANKPVVTIKLAGRTVKAKCADVFLDKDPQPGKGTKFGKYVSVKLSCMLSFGKAAETQVSQGLTELQDGEKIVYTFKTPKLKASAKVQAGESAYTANSYKGVSAFSNKSMKVTETVKW
jgi:hypothetical protein